jgi:hypothetical protein
VETAHGPSRIYDVTGIGMRVVGSSDVPTRAGSTGTTSNIGRTWAYDLTNLVLLCSFHHRFSPRTRLDHQGDPAGRLTFHKPDGSIYPPPRPELDPRLRELVRT